MKIALIGNCQVRSYWRILTDALNSPTIRILDFSTPESRQEEVRKEFCASIENFDYVFTQVNGLSFTRPEDIQAQVSHSCAVIKVCNFYFRGLHPDLCYLGKFGNRVGWNDYNSLTCLNGFKKGLSPGQVVTQLGKGEVGDDKIMNAWSDSIAELGERDNACDFPGSLLVDTSSRLYQAFYTINHPHIRLLQDYIYNILSVLDIGYARSLYDWTDDPLSFLQYPVYDFWARINGLQYRTAQSLRIHASFFSLEEFFLKSYQAYEKVALDDLVVNSPSSLA